MTERAKEQSASGATEAVGDRYQLHPEWGPCDGFGPKGACSECGKLRCSSEEEWNEWMASGAEGYASGKAGGVDSRLIPVKYEIEGTRWKDGRFPWYIATRQQRDGSFKWVVIDDSENLLNRDGDRDTELQPSSRTDEFMARTRFNTAQEALDAYLRALEAGKIKLWTGEAPTTRRR